MLEFSKYCIFVLQFIVKKKTWSDSSIFFFTCNSSGLNFCCWTSLQSKADAFEYADQVLERWYPTIEDGSNKGIVVLVTSQKEGAITGGPDFVKAVGDSILDATVSENLPGIMYILLYFPSYDNFSAL